MSVNFKNEKMFGLAPNEVNGLKYTFTALFVMLALAFIVMPVSAGSVTVAVNSILPNQFNFSVVPQMIELDLTNIGANYNTTAIVLNVDSNSGYTISARDALTDLPGFSGTRQPGHLILFDGSSQYMNYQIQAPLEVGTTETPYVSMTGTDQVIAQTTGAGHLESHVTFRQTINSFDHPTLGLQRYREAIMITGTPAI